MKKTILILIVSFLSNFLFGQNLVQSNFISQVIPQYMGSGSSSRLPVVFRASLTGLAPNTTYRYFCNLALRTDFGTTNSGAGNPLFLRNGNFGYSTSASLANNGNFDSLVTDVSGNYTGWFAVVNTGNARFTAGNYVFPSIVLDSAGAKRGVANSRFCLNDSIAVLGFATTAGASNGSFIRGLSAGTPKNLVLLFADTASTNKPLSIAIIESMGATIASIVPDYATNVQAVSGAWGAIVPNTLPNGVKRIEQRLLSNGNYVNGSKSTDGIWGSVSTLSPTNGLTGLVINATAAPLPVKLISFNVNHHNENVLLTWATSSEFNNKGFEVERSFDGKNFTAIGFVKGAGNANRMINYTFTDNNNQTAYYRLKQVDFDGKFDYSKTLILNKIENLSLELSPNPFGNNLTLVSSKQITKIEIIDMTGKVKLVELINSNKAEINTSELNNGVYFIRINNGETIVTKRIVKN